MRNSVRFWSAAGMTLLAVVVGSAAIAQLTADERKCTDAVYKSARDVGNQEQKHNRTCVKDGSLDIDACVDAESAKAADKRAKLLGLDDPDGKCATTPAFGVNANLADVADGVEDGTDNIMRGAFGDPVDVGVAGDKCGDAVAKRAGKAYDTILKSFRGCAKGRGAINSINDLDGCAVTAAADPKAANFISKLSSDMDKKCTFMSPPTGMEDGDCSSCSDGTTCSACVGRITKCAACDAINNATGGSADCDLVDDGIANASCGGTASHTCNLAPSPASQLQMHIAALPVPLTFGLSGSLAIGTAGNTATCQVQAINPVNIPAIGFVCISPGASCAPGVRYCGPGAPASGPPLGVAIGSDGNDGACASNAACQASAVALCAAEFGPGFTVLTAQCTGQCSGSTPQACTMDSACQPSNGTCNGPEPVGAHAGICQVSCVNLAGS